MREVKGVETPQIVIAVLAHARHDSFRERSSSR